MTCHMQRLLAISSVCFSIAIIFVFGGSNGFYFRSLKSTLKPCYEVSFFSYFDQYRNTIEEEKVKIH